MKLQPNLKK